MSDYCRIKAVRYKLSQENLKILSEVTGEEDKADILNTLEDIYPDLFRSNSRGYFDIACTTEDYYLDYVWEYDYGYTYGEFGKIRKLYPNEVTKMKEFYKQLGIDVEEENLRLVDYCYYTCSEPEDYFDETEDPFYKSLF